MYKVRTYYLHTSTPMYLTYLWNGHKNNVFNVRQLAISGDRVYTFQGMRHRLLHLVHNLLHRMLGLDQSLFAVLVCTFRKLFA